MFYAARMQLTRFQKLRNICTKGKIFLRPICWAVLLLKEQLLLNQLKHKQVTPQVLFPTLADDNQITPVPWSVEIETVLLSQKARYHPISAEFGNDHLSTCTKEKGKNIRFEPLDEHSFEHSFENVKPVQCQNKKLIKKSNKTLLQQNAVFNDTDST